MIDTVGENIKKISKREKHTEKQIGHLGSHLHQIKHLDKELKRRELELMRRIKNLANGVV